MLSRKWTLLGVRQSWVWIPVAVVLAVTLGRPSAFGSTDKATWITEASNYVLNNMSQVDSFMWFNNAKSGEPDWRIVPMPPPSPAPDPDTKVINAYNAAWHDTSRSLSRGVFIDGVPLDQSNRTALIDRFDGYVNPHDRIGWFESFDPTTKADLLERLNWVDARGSRPYIVWQPYDDSAGYYARGTQSLLPSIIPVPGYDGDYDDTIRTWAQAAKDFDEEFDIVLGHEMNGNWFSWGYVPDDYYDPILNPNPQPITDPNAVGHNNNTPQMFMDFFQHVVDIFDQEGADKVSFVWDVNADWIDTFKVAFPGDAYADRMGMNGFNWGYQKPVDPNNPNWDDWREFSQIFADWGGFSTYQELTTLSTHPIIIGEFGTNVPEPATLVLLAAGGLVVLRRRRRG